MKMNQMMAALLVIIGICHILGVDSATHASPQCTPVQMMRRRIALLEKAVELLMLVQKTNKIGGAETGKLEELMSEISHPSNSLIENVFPDIILERRNKYNFVLIDNLAKTSWGGAGPSLAQTGTGTLFNT